MEHVAIDLGAKESQICVRNAGGQILMEERTPTSALPGWLRQIPTSKVVLETCSESFVVADAARDAGHDVRVVPGTLVRALGVGARGKKSDVRDARALSEASCRVDLPSVHIASQRSREWKAICGMRDALVRARTKLINTVRGWLRTNLIRARSGAVYTLPRRVRDACDAIPPHVERQLQVIETLTDQIKAADTEIDELTKECTICRRLMTIAGVGPVTAMRFVAVIDNVERFAGAHAVASYLGLTPGEHSSGEKKRTTGITKAGPADLRWVLVQSAWTFMRSRPNDATAQWAAQVMERRGRKVGVVALARKLAGILFAMWRDDTSYRTNIRPTRSVISASAVLQEARKSAKA